MADDLARKEVLQAEQELYGAMLAHDVVALERMLSADVVYVHSTAVAESREEYLAGVAAGRYEYERIATRNVRVRVHGEVALTDGICEMHVGLTRPAKGVVHLVFVMAWVKQDGAWRLQHRHATRIPASQA